MTQQTQAQEDMIQTRAQSQMSLAADKVSEVAAQNREVQNIYGGMCHKFPVLVRTCGLCQAVVFSEMKRAGANADRSMAHGLLLQHIGALIQSIDPGANGDPVVAIRAANTSNYIRYTRQILAGWIYFKRFAVSILEVSDSQAAEADRADGGA